MNVRAYYKNKKDQTKENLSQLKVYDVYFSFAKLSLVVVSLVLLFIDISILYFLISFMFFIAVVIKDHKNNSRIKDLKYRIQLYKEEISSLNGIHSYDNGAQFLDKFHKFSYDLDVFGDNSIFHMMNRTSTSIGYQKLADWLLNTNLDKSKIMKNQELISELSKKSEFRENIQIAYKHVTNHKFNLVKIWLDSKDVFQDGIKMKLFVYGLPILTISLILLGIFTSFNIIWALLSAVIQSYFSMKYSTRIKNFHERVSSVGTEFQIYSDLLKSIELEKFESKKFISYQEELFKSDLSSKKIFSLVSSCLNNLDMRYNFALLPFVSLFYIDIHQVLKFQRIRKQYATNIERWLEIIAEIDAYSSIANFAFNHPTYVYPTIDDSKFNFKATNLAHPMIKEDDNVGNDFEIKSKPNMTLITGSNMAGKSTFLRSVGVNIILANLGAPVCAESMTYKPVNIISSMRISDSLDENISTFYAELKKLKNVLDAAKNNENVILLLDEILRGTNSNDRHIGSKALIRQLLSLNCVGIVATHDLELAKLEQEYKEVFENYNFNVKVTNENKLIFDYKLNHGICDSFNASILMKEIGLDIEL
jgi:hypothetical protein